MKLHTALVVGCLLPYATSAVCNPKTVIDGIASGIQKLTPTVPIYHKLPSRIPCALLPGSVEEANYPARSRGAYTCDWLLSRGGSVSISIQRLDLQPASGGSSGKCSSNYVEVRGDGETEDFSGTPKFR